MTISLFESPIGKIYLVEEDGFITSLSFSDELNDKGIECFGDTPVTLDVKKQLAAYFKGELKEFTVPIFLKGTAFQKKVWAALQKIPYGKTISYLDLATLIGNQKATRAVGQANHYNPIPIIVPCHRVINASGNLGGYGGGIDIKRKLLELEKVVLNKNERN